MMQPRGVALLISIMVASVVLAITLALVSMNYKQVVLSISGKQSQQAFYAADAAMECALYWDRQKGAFAVVQSPYLASGFSCADRSGKAQRIAFPPNTSTVSGSTRTTTFTIPCTGGGQFATVRVVKGAAGDTNIYATGYSSCDASDPKRVERGLKSTATPAP